MFGSQDNLLGPGLRPYGTLMPLHSQFPGAHFELRFAFVTMDDEKEAQAKLNKLLSQVEFLQPVFTAITWCKRHLDWIPFCKEAVKELEGAKVAGERIRVEADKLESADLLLGSDFSLSASGGLQGW